MGEQYLIRTNMFRYMLVVIVLAVVDSVPGRKRPREEVTVRQSPVYVTGRSRPRCWTEYQTDYDTVYENECKNVYDQRCSTTSYREECVMDYSLPDECIEIDNIYGVANRRRRSPLSIDCSPNAKVLKENCYNVPEKSCQSVPKQVCKRAPVRKVGRQICSG